MGPSEYRSQSFWHDTVPGSLEPRPPLTRDEHVDVAIVGAGYTGLWTAYYLSVLQPGIRVAVVEAEIAGFGASGRNGGWCLAGLAGIGSHFANPSRRDGAVRLQRAMFETVDEVGRVSADEGIDCHWRKSGSLSVASSQTQRRQLLDETRHLRELGFGEHEYRWLESEESRAIVRTSTNLGGLFMPACAALHPARLARGLAEVVERRGVAIYEKTPALEIESGAVVTRGGRLRADTVVRAAEAYTRTIRGQERALLPVHSMMVATAPLPEETWREIGLAQRETFGDPRRIVVYGQRTADDRIAFGTRGAYFYDSEIRDRFSPDDPAFEKVRRTLESMLPVLRGCEITHRWGGALGIPRDWRPSVGIDRKRGFAWAGGYVGEGVAASNLAARTLGDLILERKSELVELPLVGPRFPSWEPEPLRWLATSTLARFAESLDDAELQDRPPPRVRGAIFGALVQK
jgi:glycine/D-amino acid oxidase-like deaminating enzyme